MAKKVALHGVAWHFAYAVARGYGYVGMGYLCAFVYVVGGGVGVARVFIAAKVCLDALFPRFETVEEGHVRRQVY